MTTDQACRALGVDWHTFIRWQRLLKLDPATPHPYNRRIKLVTSATVEAIRDARGELVEVTLVSSESSLNATQPHVSRSASDKPRLPVGWISFNRWCEVHHITALNSKRDRQSGEMPEPTRGEWWDRIYRTLNAYSPEQHEAASAYARRRWPDRFVSCPACSLESDIRSLHPMSP